MSGRASEARGQKKRKRDAVVDPVVKVDTKYNEDEADVLLMSADGTLFKTHSYSLKTHSIDLSEVFRDMFANKTVGPASTTRRDEDDVQNKRSDDAIPLSYSSTAIRFWLDSMDILSKVSPKANSLTELKEAFRLAQQFDCPYVCKVICEALQQEARNHPFQVFIIAAQMNDVSLAKHAISLMGDEKDPKYVGKLNLFTMAPGMFEDCPQSYLIGFLRVTSLRPGAKEVNNWRGIEILNEDGLDTLTGKVLVWQVVARRFETA